MTFHMHIEPHVYLMRQESTKHGTSSSMVMKIWKYQCILKVIRQLILKFRLGKLIKMFMVNTNLLIIYKAQVSAQAESAQV